jgi:hypothetical protein
MGRVMRKGTYMHIYHFFNTRKLQPAVSFSFSIILSLTFVFFCTNLNAQNRKPNFSQLDFDDKIRKKPTEPPPQKPLNPLDRFLKDAKNNDSKHKKEEKKPVKTPSNMDRKSQI